MKGRRTLGTFNLLAWTDKAAVRRRGRRKSGREKVGKSRSRKQEATEHDAEAQQLKFEFKQHVICKKMF